MYKSTYIATIAALLIMLIIQGIPVVAYAPAYPTPGSGAPKWPNDKITDLKYYVEDDENWPFQDLRALWTGISIWNSLHIVKLVPTYSLSSADIIFRYGGSGCGGGTWTGVSDDRYINKAEITLAFGCQVPYEWKIAVAVHEIGHALGFGHSQAAALIMGEEYNQYHLPMSLLDDILAMWMLYGRGTLVQPDKLGELGYNDDYMGGPAELGGYPVAIRIDPGVNHYVFYGHYKATYCDGAYMIFGFINPHTLYRGAIGFWKSTDATDQAKRVAIVEISKTGSMAYAALSYTKGGSSQEVKYIVTSYSSDKWRDTGFFVQLMIYVDANYNTRAVAIVYRGTDILGYIGCDNAPKLYYGYYYWIPYYIGFAAWTDTGSDPSSKIQFWAIMALDIIFIGLGSSLICLIW